MRIFERVGLGGVTYKTFASGGSFSKYSHEFQTVCDAGEDTIYIDETSKQALNKEVYDDLEVYVATGMQKDALRCSRAPGCRRRFAATLAFAADLESGRATTVLQAAHAAA